MDIKEFEFTRSIEVTSVLTNEGMVLVYWRWKNNGQIQYSVMEEEDYEKTIQILRYGVNVDTDTLFPFADFPAPEGMCEYGSQKPLKLHPVFVTPEGLEQMRDGRPDYWNKKEYYWEPKEFGEPVPEDVVMIWFCSYNHFWTDFNGAVIQEWIHFFEVEESGWDVRGLQEYINTVPELDLTETDYVPGNGYSVYFRISATPEEVIAKCINDWNAREALYRKYGVDKFDKG